MARPKVDDPEQSRRFIEIAEAHKATKEGALKEAVKKLAGHGPAPSKPDRSTLKR